MIQLHITSTGKGYSPKSQWQMFDEQTKTFADVAAAQVWLKDTYGKCTRDDMYIDGPDGKGIKIGYVYGFRNADLSHVPVDKWIQRDWVEFRTVTPLDLSTVPLA